ncbi:hypothetical protein [Aureimonas sp. ME7]|uniref:hypothetical protein n=1 Tax=Aureimonas sp. ME7 TaxID=2744252 RepID=UPI0015F6964B|nr:hypothetical protein [Aureimonas sp. ME7]
MSRIDETAPTGREETETDRINRYERSLPNGGRVENEPDPENEEEGGLVPDPDTSEVAPGTLPRPAI